MADTQCITATGTTLGATHFITGAIFTGEAARVVDLAAPELVPALTRRTDPRTRTSAGAAQFPAARPLRRGLSTETPKRLEATPSLEVRQESGRAPSTATPMADSRGAIPRAEAPAWVAEQHVEVAGAERHAAVVAEVAEDHAAVGADADNRDSKHVPCSL